MLFYEEKWEKEFLSQMVVAFGGAQSRYGSPPGPHTKTRLGLCPKTPLPLNCGWIRSQGACGAFIWDYCKPIAESHAAKTIS